jgi:hypothetical protein
MDTLFNVTFLAFSNPLKAVRFTTKKEDVSSFNGEDMITFKENIDISVIFKAPNGARLYMDGLDTLPENSVKEDEKGEVYLAPSEYQQTIYSNNFNNGEDEYYPFIPGYYRIKVKIEEVSYYSLIRVIPKQVSEEQWTIMRDEVEETLHGLAQDLIRRNSNIEGFGDSPIPFSYMRQWLILQKYRGRLINSLEQIITSPRYEIRKEYNIVPTARAFHFNEVSIKYVAQHPDKKDVIKEPSPKVSYNIPENRWFRYMVKSLLNITQDLLLFLKDFEKSVTNEMNNLQKWGDQANVRLRMKQKVLSQIKKMITEAGQFRSVWNRSLNALWMTEVKDKLPKTMPMALTLDSRYRIVFQMFRELKNDQFSISLEPAYTYHWKRTDHLYEIWGFTQIIRVLTSESLGFKPVKGWLYEMTHISKGVIVPELNSGSFVELTKGNLCIRVVYEEELPPSTEGTSLNKPLYTGSSHNLPDCRIDVFDQKGHIGSLLLDFKYRPKHSIWDTNKIKTRRQTKTMKQLDSYINSCRSPWYLKGRNSDRVIKSTRPVSEVWPIFPERNNIEHERELDEYHVRLMDLTPGKPNIHFQNTLKWILQEMQEVAEALTITK